MPGSVIIAAGPDGALGFLYLAWKGILGVLGFCLALNVRDAAYRVYEFFTSRGPFAPGPGFSPLVIRIVGALIGAVSTWSFVSGVTS
jgi:hypothetical protein